MLDDRNAAKYLRHLGACLLAIPLLLSLYIALFPMAFSDRAYALWSFPIEIARGSARWVESDPGQEDARVLILGDSRIQAAVIPDQVGAGVLNLALMSSTPIDSDFLLRDYLEHHRAPESIVISFAPYHLQGDYQRFFWNHSVKYGAHDFEDFLAILERSHQLGEPLLPDASRPRVALEWLLYRARFAPYYLPELKAAKLFMRHAENMEARADLETSRGHFAFGKADGNSAIAKEAEFERFESAALLDRYLRDLIARCLSAGSEVVFRAMPFNQSSRSAMSPQYLADYAGYVDALQLAYPEITADAELAFLPDSHFGDGSHLNARGAQYVSEALRSELKSRAERIAKLRSQRP